MRPSFFQLASAGRWEDLAQRLAARFEVPVDPEQLRRACARDFKPARLDKLVDDYFVVWLKNRLTEMGAFGTEEGRSGKDAGRLTVPLHVFFLCLEETAEMLQRLARDDGEVAASAARSKVFTTPLVPRPVDQVAGRVSGIRQEG